VNFSFPVGKSPTLLRACPAVAGPGLVAPQERGTARRAFASGPSGNNRSGDRYHPTPITNRQHHHGDGDDHHHDVYEDERGIFFPVHCGFGLLIFVRARNTTGVADAIAAGSQYASDKKS